ncbi:MAG: hypothetical protein KJ607_13310, partial [Bacteroidetes bacterium]|nr:hypothetical protein [Bacteroidota bacterium]
FTFAEIYTVYNMTSKVMRIINLSRRKILYYDTIWHPEVLDSWMAGINTNFTLHSTRPHTHPVINKNCTWQNLLISCISK